MLYFLLRVCSKQHQQSSFLLSYKLQKDRALLALCPSLYYLENGLESPLLTSWPYLYVIGSYQLSGAHNGFFNIIAIENT